MGDLVKFKANSKTATRFRQQREAEKRRIIAKIGFNDDRELYDEYLRFLACMAQRGQEI